MNLVISKAKNVKRYFGDKPQNLVERININHLRFHVDTLIHVKHSLRL